VPVCHCVSEKGPHCHVAGQIEISGGVESDHSAVAGEKRDKIEEIPQEADYCKILRAS